MNADSQSLAKLLIAHSHQEMMSCIWDNSERTCTSCTATHYQLVTAKLPTTNLHWNLHWKMTGASWSKRGGFQSKGGGLCAKGGGLELFHGLEQMFQAVGTLFWRRQTMGIEASNLGAGLGAASKWTGSRQPTVCQLVKR